MRSLEEKTVDARFGVRGSEGPPSDVVVVEIDDDTFNDAQRVQWPFPRCCTREVIDQIAKGAPARDRVDIQFTEPSDGHATRTAIDAATRNC